MIILLISSHVIILNLLVGDTMFEGIAIIPIFSIITAAMLFFMFATLARVLAEPFLDTKESHR